LQKTFVRAAGEVGERDVGAGQAVGRLVERAVAAEGDDDVVALAGASRTSSVAWPWRWVSNAVTS
jgi:hypothetical protein